MSKAININSNIIANITSIVNIPNIITTCLHNFKHKYFNSN